MTLELIRQAIASRAPMVDARHERAFRLFNGFSEGDPNFVLDVYARTLVLHNYADDPSLNEKEVQEIIQDVLKNLDWIKAVVLKLRNAKTQEQKLGKLMFGQSPDKRIREDEIWYAVDLTLNRDASFYLDTSNVRKWLKQNMRGKSVLNMFAYTGSLGVAALAGDAKEVIQADLNRRFLNIAKESYSLNGFPIRVRDFIAQDFFSTVGRFKKENRTFDCVIIDPPFFSATAKGRVDLVRESSRLINKVRPLINDGGYLIVINNALYVSGKEFHKSLQELCRDGFLSIDELIPVPEDCLGYNPITSPIVDPSPFNHSTKIAVLKVRRKAT